MPTAQAISSLDDLLDLVEEVADKFVLYQLAAPPAGAADMAELLARSFAVLVEATLSVRVMVEALASVSR